MTRATNIHAESGIWSRELRNAVPKRSGLLTCRQSVETGRRQTATVSVWRRAIWNAQSGVSRRFSSVTPSRNVFRSSVRDSSDRVLIRKSGIHREHISVQPLQYFWKKKKYRHTIGKTRYLLKKANSCQVFSEYRTLRSSYVLVIIYFRSRGKSVQSDNVTY